MAASAAVPSIMPQRASALSISAAASTHNGTTVRMKSVCDTHTHTESRMLAYLCTRVTSVLGCTKCAQVCPHCSPSLPSSPPGFDHFAAPCFQEENLFWRCSSVFQRKLHLTSFLTLSASLSFSRLLSYFSLCVCASFRQKLCTI